MDEMVAVGTAGLLGFALAALLAVGTLIWFSGMVWAAWTSGDWRGVTHITGVLFILALGYLGIGIWLHKTGRI